MYHIMYAYAIVYWALQLIPFITGVAVCLIADMIFWWGIEMGYRESEDHGYFYMYIYIFCKVLLEMC